MHTHRDQLTSSHSAPAVSKPTSIGGIPNRLATTLVESTKISADLSRRKREKMNVRVFSSPLSQGVVGLSMTGSMVVDQGDCNGCQRLFLATGGDLRHIQKPDLTEGALNSERADRYPVYQSISLTNAVSAKMIERYVF
jgi:hypothetical protein